jgi:hypothetical protein
MTLWCNNNEISDLKKCLKEIQSKFPALRYLSMMVNPGVPALHDDLEGVDNGDLEGLTSHDNSSNNVIPPAIINDSPILNRRSGPGDELTRMRSTDSNVSADMSTGSPRTTESEAVKALECSMSNMSNINLGKKQLPYTLQEYRQAILFMLPHLRVLDGVDVTLEVNIATNHK